MAGSEVGNSQKNEDEKRTKNSVGEVVMFHRAGVILGKATKKGSPTVFVEQDNFNITKVFYK